MSDVRLAATVILVRSPLEVYLTRRSARSAFAPDAFVFPGGTVEAQDATPEAQARTIGLEPDRLRKEFRASISP
ncbi:MAG: NUDIX domain-containing protein, partial [Candidatus Cybelea sp.]